MRIRDIVQFVEHPSLVGGQLSAYQRVALKLLYGLRLDRKEQAIARKALDTDQLPPPGKPFNEATFICGRRSGKSERLGANIATYEAVTGDHRKFLAPGETAFTYLIEPTLRQAQELRNLILAKLEGSKLLRPLVAKVTRLEISLRNRATIACYPCDFRHTRGPAVRVLIADEFGFWRSEGANIDRQVVDAIRPAMAQFPGGGKLIKISSPYSKTGELYRDFATRHKRSDLLVVHAPSWLMNPSLSKRFLKAEMLRDREHFDREYAALFTDSIASAFSRDAVEDAVVEGRRELPYDSKLGPYTAGVDPSGGGADEFCLSVSHREKSGAIVQDCLRAYRSSNPAGVVREMAKTLRSYHISKVRGDRYSGEWVRSAFAQHGIRYEVADLSTSDAFLELLPLVNAGRIELLDDAEQTRQLIALERRRGRSGKDSLGHPQGGHDDRVTALALSAYYAGRRKSTGVKTFMPEASPRPGLEPRVTGDNLFDLSLGQHRRDLGERQAEYIERLRRESN